MTDLPQPAVRTAFAGAASLILAMPLILAAVLLSDRPLASLSILSLGLPLLVVALLCRIRRHEPLGDVLSRWLCRGFLMFSLCAAVALWFAGGWPYALCSLLGAYGFLLREDRVRRVVSGWGMSF